MIFASTIQAQEVEYISANNINAGIGIGGNLFSRLDSSMNPRNDTASLWNLFEMPKGSNKRQIFTASLWTSGRDLSQTLICAGQAYRDGGGDFNDGPIASVYDNTYDNFYKRVFKVAKAQIDAFRLLSFPVSVVQIDTAILRWPAKGNAWVTSAYNTQINSTLAPFVDIDNDGNYNPLVGDYPLICGDEAIFFVFNDARGFHQETNSSNKFGIEVRGLAYSFVDNSVSNLPAHKEAVNNTVFVSYDIENKSSNNYHDFCLGLFEDPDLGCFMNDGVGCDTIRNMMFAYNRTMPDPLSNCNGVYGYGNVSISTGTLFLTSAMNAFGFFQGIYDACSTMTNNMHGYINDTLPFTDNHGNVTRFTFPGDLNDTLQWSEVTRPQLYPGDRRVFGSLAPMSFSAGETKHLDLAFFTSYDSTSTMYQIVDTLKRDADIVQQFYNNQVLPCRSAQIASKRSEVIKESLAVSIYPNPTSSQMKVECNRNINAISLHDLSGRVLFEDNPDTKQTLIEVSDFAQGLYLLRISSGEVIVVRKIVLQ